LTAEEDEIEEKSETEEPAVCPVEAVMDVQEKNVDCTDPAEGGDLESMDPMEIPCAEEAKDGASEDVNDDSTSGGEMKECIGEFKEE
jgi:translation elongation factor EF-Tu-like GTPase